MTLEQRIYEKCPDLLNEKYIKRVPFPIESKKYFPIQQEHILRCLPEEWNIRPGDGQFLYIDEDDHVMICEYDEEINRDIYFPRWLFWKSLQEQPQETKLFLEEHII